MDEALIHEEGKEDIDFRKLHLKFFIMEFDDYFRIPLEKYLDIPRDLSAKERGDKWTEIKVKYGGKEVLLHDKTRMKQFLGRNYEKLKEWEFTAIHDRWTDIPFFICKTTIQNYEKQNDLKDLTGEILQYLRHHFDPRNFGDLLTSSTKDWEDYNQKNNMYCDLIKKLSNLMMYFRNARGCGGKYDQLIAQDNSVEEQIRATELCLERPEVFIREVSDSLFWRALIQIHPVVVGDLEEGEKKGKIERILDGVFGEEGKAKDKPQGPKVAGEVNPKKTQPKKNKADDELHNLYSTLLTYIKTASKQLKETKKTGREDENRFVSWAMESLKEISDLLPSFKESGKKSELYKLIFECLNKKTGNEKQPNKIVIKLIAKDRKSTESKIERRLGYK